MKKKKSIVDGILYFINSIFALLLLIGYAIPYIKPQTLNSLSGFSLLTPLFVMVNLAFLAYWILRLKRIFLLPLIVLLIGFNNIPRLYKLNAKRVILTDDIKVMSYNVRMFNKYDWIKKDSIKEKINTLIAEKSPDILCLQEYAPNPELEAMFPHKYITYSKNNHNFGHAIFSQFPIIRKENLDFKDSSNNILYADILIGRDSLRIYNIHLESLRIKPQINELNEETALKLSERISRVFNKQQDQVLTFLDHQQKTENKVIVMGDFNNTAYSWVYRQLLKGKNDAFVIAGKGFDKTYDYPFPIRIDFILPDDSIEVNHFKRYQNKYSDHFAIMARLSKASLE